MATIVTIADIVYENVPENFSIVEFMNGSETSVIVDGVETAGRAMPRETQPGNAPNEEGAVAEAEPSSRRAEVVETSGQAGASTSGEPQAVVGADPPNHPPAVHPTIQADVCDICHDEEEPPDSKLPCDHLFHRECLMPWIVQNFRCTACEAAFGACHIIALGSTEHDG